MFLINIPKTFIPSVIHSMIIFTENKHDMLCTLPKKKLT